MLVCFSSTSNIPDKEILLCNVSKINSSSITTLVCDDVVVDDEILEVPLLTDDELVILESQEPNIKARIGRMNKYFPCFIVFTSLYTLNNFIKLNLDNKQQKGLFENLDGE